MFPTLGDVHISEISELWHSTFTIEVAKDGNHRFQYFGPELANIFGGDYTSEPVAQSLADNSMLDNTIGFFMKVVERRSPVSESAVFFMEGKEVRYRSLIVPFSSDGQVIDYLLGTANYKVFD
jgi:hypothetical protein